MWFGSAVLKKIISGGQTGVDRGALDAALELGFPCGGSCPLGRRAEDGVIPERYPVTELATDEYRPRTRQNVLDGDATLIVFFGEPSGGTLATLRICQETQKPVLTIDAAAKTPAEAAIELRAFIEQHAVSVLNVAGPRESSHPGAHDYAAALTRALLS